MNLPHIVRAPARLTQPSVDLKVRSAADVQRDASAPSSLRTIVDWLTEHIVKPHPDLGRAGPVCPFVLPALQLQCLWLSVVERPIEGDDDLCNIVAELLNLYETYESNVGEGSNLRTFIVVLPTVSGQSGLAQIVRVHSAIKPHVVTRGLMLGEFYPESTSPGVHNPRFYPLRSPMPLFVLRHMVPGDLVFLNKATDPPHRRVQFIRAYLKTLAGELTSERLGEAYRGLVAAESSLQVKL